jgi:hypothetical protein
MCRKEELLKTVTTIRQEKTAVEEKLMKLKQSVMELRDKLDTEIHRKLDTKDRLLRESNQKLELGEK